MFLAIKDITKIYQHKDGAVKALNNVTLQVSKGDFVTITGASGSGKTTLLLTLGGLIQPTAGSMHFEGRSINLKNDSDLAKHRKLHIGFVMQHFALVPYLTASENILLALNNSELNRQEQQLRSKELMHLVSLDHRQQHYPRQLSAGQQQRVAIARALANNPAMILADEPTGNLDPVLAMEIMDTLREVNRTYGATIIMVTHSTEAAAYGTRRLQMERGSVAYSDSQSESL